MNVEVLALISTVVVAHFLALVSPGPDFLLIVKSAMRSRKSRAIGVAFGIASANGIYILLCIVGVGSVLASSLVVMMTLAVFLWDAFIIVMLTRKEVKAVFGRVAFYVDKVAGTLLGFIGLRLIQSALVEEAKI